MIGIGGRRHEATQSSNQQFTLESSSKSPFAGKRSGMSVRNAPVFGPSGEEGALIFS